MDHPPLRRGKPRSLIDHPASISGTPLSVVAVIVTHRRPAEVRRLLQSLSDSEVPVRGVVISDHAPDGEVRQLAAESGLDAVVLEDPSNPGPGTGWANAGRRARAHFPEADALWFLDDDVVIPPEALGVLCAEMERAGAQAIAPLLEDADGKLWAFPEPEDPAARRSIRQATTPAEALKLLGAAPLPFCWCTGACFLVTKAAVDAAGWHRGDFWMLGEDLEYSMRVAARVRAVFTCRVSVPHRPPGPADPTSARRGDYLKFCSLLQNLSYLAVRSPHSRHMKSYLAGNYRRFFRTHGWHIRTLRDASACLWHGAVRARPAGTASGETLRRRIRGYPLS